MKHETYEFMMRRIPAEKRLLPTEHKALMTALGAIQAEPWIIDMARIPPLKITKGDSLQCVNLSKALSFKARCSINYRLPDKFTPTPDGAASDDFFTLEFRPEDPAYATFLAEVLEQYLAAFRPYRAHCGPSSLAGSDFPIARQLNARKSLYRIYPVDFFSDSFVATVIGKSSEELVRILTPMCDSVFQTQGGVLIRSDNVQNVTESKSFSLRLLSALGPDVKTTKLATHSQ